VKHFIRRALEKFDKLTGSQLKEIIVSSSNEMERLEAVLDSIMVGILVCDRQHNIILTNKSAERLLPIDDYEPGGDQVWFVVRDEAVSEFLRKTLNDGDHVEGAEFEINTHTISPYSVDQRTGVTKRLSISVMPLVQEHKVIGSLIHIEDITERREREDKMRRIESLASLTTLAAGVAHEIKNPLGSISIHIQLIQKTLKAAKKCCDDRHKFVDAFMKGSPQYKGGKDPRDNFSAIGGYLNIVNEEIDRLNRIVVDFLSTVRPVNLDIAPADMNALITSLIEFVSMELADAGITWKLSLDKKLDIFPFDERAMKQALLNLIKNSKEAMPGGGILTIKTLKKESEVLISIEDTGVGIAPDKVKNIFEPYYTTKQTGSGLGLILVFKVISEHKGEIAVKSKLGKGTGFLIKLPLPQGVLRLLDFRGGPK
jgi:PAS domain S-box-containing protein